MHVHTVESDGVLSVQDVVVIASKSGVNILSITDHESTQGVKDAQHIGNQLKVKIIPGVELLTSYQEQEIHLLGYFKDVNNSELQRYLKELRILRTAQSFDIVKLIQQVGFPLKWQDVEKEASTDGAVTKGHIMRAMYHNDMLNPGWSWQEIGALFLPGGIAYIPFLENRFENAVDFIFASGGIPVLAHPGIISKPELVFKLLSYRTIGLEVYYGYWENRHKLISYYAEIAEKIALFATGGSDFHGPFSRVGIGDMDVPHKGIKALENYLNID